MFRLTSLAHSATDAAGYVSVMDCSPAAHCRRADKIVAYKSVFNIVENFTFYTSVCSVATIYG